MARKLHIRGANLIRNLHFGFGYTISTLALLFRLSESLIIDIIRNKVYRDNSYKPQLCQLPLIHHYYHNIATNPEYNHFTYENFFVPIKDYSNYIICCDGTIFSKYWNRYEKLTPIYYNGYARVVLSKNKQLTYYFVHRLIGEHFLPNPDNKPNVCHKNDIKTDNRLTNLYWGDQKDNMEDKFRNGRYVHRIPNATKNEIYKTIQMFPDIATNELARRFGLSQQSMRRIRKEFVENNLISNPIE